MLRRGVKKEGDSGFAQHLCLCACSVIYVPGWRVAKYLVSHDCLWSRQKKKKKKKTMTLINQAGTYLLLWWGNTRS